eukprot:753676-Hanusia_phi.AAC.20
MAHCAAGSQITAFAPHLSLPGLAMTRCSLAIRPSTTLSSLSGKLARAPRVRLATKLRMQETDPSLRGGQRENIRKYGLLAAWACFVGYGVFFAPEVVDGSSKQLLADILDPSKLSTVNPIFFAIFNLLGVWPAVMASLLFPLKPKSQNLPASPFVFGSFALGAFALTPYLALTDYDDDTDKGWLKDAGDLPLFLSFMLAPVIGACLWLVVRPDLPEMSRTSLKRPE